MLDTFRISHITNPPPMIELLKYGAWRQFYSLYTGKASKLVLNEAGRPQLTWSLGSDGMWRLHAEESAPTFLFGNNVMIVSGSDMGRLLNSISIYVSQASGIEYDASTATVGRFDACYNFYDETINIIPRISALSILKVPRMNSQVINSTTVEFQNSTGKIMAYSKLHAVITKGGTPQEIEAAANILRIERRTDDYNAIKRLARKYGVERTAEQLLTEDVCYAIIESAMKKLNLDKPLPAKGKRFNVLRRAYGVARAADLMKFLELLEHYGVDFYNHPECKGKRGLGRSTYFNAARDCRRVNVWLESPDQRALEPLKLVRGDSSMMRAA